MACLFTKEELVNGNPSGETSSKSEQRKMTIQKLDTSIMRYIEGKCASTIYTCILLVTHDDMYYPFIHPDKVETKWAGSFRQVLRQMTQKCTDAYNNPANACLRH